MFSSEKVSSLSGCVISLSCGAMFIIGTDISNIFILALASIAIIISMGNKVLFEMKLIRFIVFFSLIVFFSALVRVISVSGIGTDFSVPELFTRIFVYLRLLITIVVCLFFLSLSYKAFLKGLRLGGAWIIYSSLLLLIPFAFGYIEPLNLFRSFFGLTVYTGFTGFFHNPNYWAMLILFLLLFLGFERSVDEKNTFNYSLPIIFSILNLLFTGSRMAIILGIIIIIIIFIDIFKLLSYRKKLFSFFLSSFFILVSFFNTNIYNEVSFKDSVAHSNSTIFEKIDKKFAALNDLENEPRYLLAMDYLNGVSDNSILGLGMGNFFSFLVTHNNYILLLVEFGSVVSLIVLAYIAKVGWDNRRCTLGLMIIIVILLMSFLNDLIDVRIFAVALSIPLYKSGLKFNFK